MLVAVHSDPLVVLPTEMNWTALEMTEYLTML